MNILLSFISLSGRSGGELFVRDLAMGLSGLGYTIYIFSPLLGELADELRCHGIKCISVLDTMEIRPDIIIGNSHVETVLCLSYFPNTPVISVCHDAVAPHGIPPMFSRISSYVAVDALCEERLRLEYQIDSSRINIIHNRVDLNRFQYRSNLPERPKIAAIFSNYATNGEETRLVRSVCTEFGIKLHTIGKKFGNQSDSPERILNKYDLIFAKARCAMEAMVVGCAVILLNEDFGMAGLVTSNNVAEWQRWNFGRKLLSQNKIESWLLRREIRKYSVSDATRVSAFMRTHCSLEDTVLEFERLISKVLKDKKTYSNYHTATEQQEFKQFEKKYLISKSGQAQNLEILKVQLGIINQYMEHLERTSLKVDLLQKQLHAVYNSGSWTLTKPLRVMLRTFHSILDGLGNKMPERWQLRQKR